MVYRTEMRVPTQEALRKFRKPRALISIRALCAGFAFTSFSLALFGYAPLALGLAAICGCAVLILGVAGELTVKSRKSGGGRGHYPQLFAELTETGHAITDGYGRLLWVNPAGVVLLKQLPDILGPSNTTGDAGHAAAFFRLLQAGLRGESSAQRVPVRSGSPLGNRNVRLSVKPEPGAKPGNPSQARLFWTIVAEEGAAAEAVQPADGQGKPEVNLEALPAAAFLLDSRGQLAGANAHLRSLLKLPPEAGISGHITALLFDIDGQPLRGMRWRSMFANVPQAKATLKTSSGQFIPVLIAASLHSQADGKTPKGWLCFAMPARRAIKGEAKAGFPDLFHAAPLAIACIRRDGRLVEANLPFMQLFNGGNGKRLTSLFDAIDADAAIILREKLALASHEALPAETPKPFTIQLHSPAKRRVQLFLGHGATADETLIYAIDNTSQHQLEEQVAQSEKMQAVGQLAGGIAHDFNNVLTAIIGFSDLLLARLRPSDPAFMDIIRIKQSANRAADLVRHLLAYSRQQTLRPKLLTFTDVIEDFHASLGRLLGERVKARIQHGRDLWTVKADESQLFQVIMNLSVNARDAMPQGGELCIRTANIGEGDSLAYAAQGLPRGEYVMLEVRDTGTGIAPEHLEKIFEPFFSTKDVGKGTGLGLSTVYGIIKQTGGTVLVDSKLGLGTTFRIFLPRYSPAAGEDEALPTEARHNGDAKTNGKDRPADLTGTGTVLLVEDEEAVRSFASRALATRGYKVLEAASGVEALEVMEAQEHGVDLVVSDVVMPEMDGPTLLHHLRQKHPGIRIVFMSGYAEEAFRKNLGDVENFMFLPKPFTLKKLAETVKEGMRG